MKKSRSLLTAALNRPLRPDKSLPGLSYFIHPFLGFLLRICLIPRGIAFEEVKLLRAFLSGNSTFSLELALLNWLNRAEEDHTGRRVVTFRSGPFWKADFCQDLQFTATTAITGGKRLQHVVLGFYEK